jgi:hypothetical protein
LAIPRCLWRRWDKIGRIPRWARIVWPRLHFCTDFDGLLTGWQAPQEEPFLCGCVIWPVEYAVFQKPARLGAYLSRPAALLTFCYTLGNMTPAEFDKAMVAVLRICRAAAAEQLPVEEMLEYAENTLDKAAVAGTPQLPDARFLLQTVGAFYDIANVGASLPPEPTPIQVPEAPDGSLPMPSNLLRGA